MILTLIEHGSLETAVLRKIPERVQFFWQTPGSRGGEFRGYLQPTQRSPGIRQRVYRTHPKAPSVVLRPNSQSFESYTLLSSVIRKFLGNLPYWTDGSAQEINRPFRGLFSFKISKLFFSDNIGAHEAACLPTLLRKISMGCVSFSALTH